MYDAIRFYTQIYFRMIYKKILIIGLLCVWPLTAAVRADNATPPDDIVKALKSGDAKGIGKYFNSSVELIFTQNQGVYGKSQAEQILKNFFDNNRGTRDFSYNHLHTNNKDNTQYYIGQLFTAKGVYRIYIYMKDGLIHQMRIESND